MCNAVAYHFLPALLWYLFQDLSPTALVNPRRTLSTEKNNNNKTILVSCVDNDYQNIII